MKTIRDLLEKQLPKILPKNPDEAINGTALLKKVKENDLFREEKDSTLRMYFSLMAADETSVIAKRTKRHGYYLRNIDDEDLETIEYTTPDNTENIEGKITSRDFQREEKFRAIFQRFNEISNDKFTMKIEHTKGKKKEKGLNKWKYPDVVILNWEVGEISGDQYRLNKTLLDVRKSLGEQPFKLSSVELKTKITFSNFREYFFQCVSNSKWSHNAILAISADIDDNKLQDELIRLGNSYDITIITYGISEDELDSMESAQHILEMDQEKFEEINNKIKVSLITTGKDRETLDWEHIKDLKSQNEDFDLLFRWISKCLDVNKAYAFQDFKKLLDVENNYV